MKDWIGHYKNILSVELCNQIINHKFSYSKSTYSTHKGLSPDDKRVEILKKRSCVESFEVDKAKELIPEYSSIARKSIAEDLNKMKKNVNLMELIHIQMII